MSSNPIPLRNIPAEVVEVAQAIARQTGLSITDVYRLALASGVLIEATKITPDRTGTFAGLDGAYLAQALRRHMSSAIDLLLAYGEHPAAGALVCGSIPPDRTLTASRARSEGTGQELAFDPAIGEDLEDLGIGLGLSGR